MHDELETLAQRGRYASVLAGLALGAAGQIAGGIMGAKAAKDAARQRQQAVQRGMEEQKAQYAETAGRYKPYEKFGGEQLNALGEKLGTPLDITSDPSYKFRFEQGQRGVEGTAAGKGMLKSGDTLRALETYGQDMASQEYQNAFARKMAEQQQLGGFASQFGMGSARDMGQFGQNKANAMANLLTGQGEAQAQGSLGSGQSWANMATGLGGLAGNAMGKYLSGPKPPMPQGGFGGGENDPSGDDVS